MELKCAFCQINIRILDVVQYLCGKHYHKNSCAVQAAGLPIGVINACCGNKRATRGDLSSGSQVSSQAEVNSVVSSSHACEIATTSTTIVSSIYTSSFSTTDSQTIAASSGYICSTCQVSIPGTTGMLSFSPGPSPFAPSIICIVSE